MCIAKKLGKFLIPKFHRIKMKNVSLPRKKYEFTTLLVFRRDKCEKMYKNFFELVELKWALTYLFPYESDAKKIRVY